LKKRFKIKYSLTFTAETQQSCGLNRNRGRTPLCNREVYSDS